MTHAEEGALGQPPPRWRVLPAVALVVLVPLAVAPGGALPFQPAKAWLVAALVPAGLAAVAATGALRWPFARWWAAWLGASAIATALGVAPWTSLVGAPGRSTGLLAVVLGAGAFVLGASLGGDPVAARRILRAAMLAGGVVAALAVAERFGAPLPGLADEATRARGTWGSATFLAGHLVLVAPIALIHLRAADPRWRRTALVTTGAIVAALLLSGTRGAWLGALVAVAVLWPARSVAGPARPAAGDGDGGSGRTRVAPALALGIAAVALGALALAGPMLDRSTAGGRLDLWRTTATPIADRPFLGSGPDTQRIVLPTGIDRTFEQQHGSEELHDRAHQLVLDTWITTGLLGVIAFGGLLISIGRALAARLHHQLAVRAIAAGLAGYLVHLAFAFGDVTLDPIAWLLAGLGIGALPVVAASGRTDLVTTPPARAPRLVAALFGALAVLSVVAGVAELAADRSLDRAVALDAEGDRVGALAELDEHRGWAPHRWDLPQARARVAERLLVGGSPLGGAPDPRRDPRALERLLADALDDVDRALAAAPGDPDLLLDRAAVLDAAGRHAAAEDAFDAVLADAYPYSSRAWLGLGTSLAAQDRPEEAIEAWERAAELAPADWRSLANLATLHLAAGRPDAAMAAVEEGLRREPDQPQLLALQTQLVG